MPWILLRLMSRALQTNISGIGKLWIQIPILVQKIEAGHIIYQFQIVPFSFSTASDWSKFEDEIQCEQCLNPAE